MKTGRLTIQVMGQRRYTAIARPDGDGWFLDGGDFKMMISFFILPGNNFITTKSFIQ